MTKTGMTSALTINSMFTSVFKRCYLERNVNIRLHNCPKFLSNVQYVFIIFLDALLLKQNSSINHNN